MAFEDEAIAAAIAIDAERVRAAVLDVPVPAESDEDLDDLLEALDAAVAAAADVPNAFGPAALDLCRFAGREVDPDLQAIAFLAGLSADSSEDTRVAASADAALLSGLSIAVLRREYAARDDALAAKSDYLTAAEVVLDSIGVTLGEAVFAWAVDLVGITASHLSDTAANRMPLVTLETNVSLPAPILAFQLYRDPERGDELVRRNRVSTPMFMPVRLTAIAPST